MTAEQISQFIDRWKKSGGAERANYQLFLTELCDVLEVPRPEPTVDDDAENAYVFEKNVVFDNGDGSTSTKRIDLYRRNTFVCETKQGTEQREQEFALSEQGQERLKKRKKGHGKRGTKGFEDTMVKARGQAEQYARHLPAGKVVRRFCWWSTWDTPSKANRRRLVPFSAIASIRLEACR